MPIVHIDGRNIKDWETFHGVFSAAFGFPGFYGQNMNAWIDCMSYLDEPDSGMTTIFATASNPMVINIDHIDDLRNRNEEIYDTMIECAAFVNWRRVQRGEPPVLMLSYYSSPQRTE